MGKDSRNDSRKIIDDLAAKAQDALHAFMELGQEDVDRIVKAMALAGLDRHMELARMAVEETGRGVYEDKIVKNIFATEYVYHSIKYSKTVGIIKVDEEAEYEEVAEPVGVIAGIAPVTNPTSTTMFKSLISIKTRNPIIFSFHPGAQRCSAAAAKTMLHAAVAAGAPESCISWIEHTSIEATKMLMSHPGVSLILATGGAGMVQSAYSSGKPALGVGPGNVPCYIEKSANLQRAVTDLILSKTFDNGMICASEQGLIVDRDVAGDIESLLVENGCYFLNKIEAEMLERFASCGKTCSLNPEVVGKPAGVIAQMAGFLVPDGTKILIARQDGVGPDYPLSREKLSPILAYYLADNSREGIKLCEQMVEYGGMGHSAVIHTADEKLVDEFARRVMAGRIIVNAPSTHGAIGDIYNTNTPSLTLGCGSYGRNSTTANVSAINLLNIKRVARRQVNMQWFRVPERIYFERGSIQYLAKMPGIGKVLVVTDKSMVELGYLDKIKYHLARRENRPAIEVFGEIEPDPSLALVTKGLKLMNSFQPDTIIALGGGSVIDAAKGMWLFYEHPEVEFEFLRLKFLDIRKRTYKFPKLGRRARLVAVPTTSGSGSEVTAFTVITDRGKDIKYPLADYELTPDVAIIDPDFVETLPRGLVADTGMDVLAHGIEAYVSVMASDYTDALCLKAIEMVFKYLPLSWREKDIMAREKMHNASTIAGMAFTNAFLGINHALAHKVGGEFGITHGRANAVLLPYVIGYNAGLPSKFVSFPKYEHYIAPEKYRQIAAHLGLPAASKEEGVLSLIEAVSELSRSLGIPSTFAELGIDRKKFMSKVPELAEKAFEDQTTTTNPRLPLITELEDILRKAYSIPLYTGDKAGLGDETAYSITGIQPGTSPAGSTLQQ
ncbi:bifunctional acetaldehyde-CoA/alcohol dehydrogenase [Pelotomaculum propionicicum]|uniref:bifunctional acetaldehyde-CoA/alcohol dehydrogenase n=1 Tax=Pelotomaculum propionicicum TaxID=258475 RepID=UPI003B7ECA46